MRSIIVIAHNIRSTHNIGAIFRTCEGLGVDKLVLSGYSPYPKLPSDPRLPHIADKLMSQIHKSALGAEEMVPFSYTGWPNWQQLHEQNYRIVGLEQQPHAIALPDYTPPERIALVLGEEVDGIAPEILSKCDEFVEIPMFGHKESYNVSVAAGIALYHVRFL